MASYGNTVLTSAGIDLVKRVIAKTATFEITRVATSSDSRLTNATISTIEALTTMSSVQQTGKVTAFDTSNSKQVGLKCEFTNQGLTNQYNICGVGIYAKEAGKSEILFAVAPAKEPETMPAKPNDQSALFAFSLNMYVVVGQASSMSITATTEGVVKSINSTIKPDANGNVTMSYYSQAEVDQKISSLSSMIDSLNGSKTSNTDFNALKNRVAANESGKADKTSVYDKGTADDRYLQRDASTTLKSGSVLIWDDSGHANDGNNVPYIAGGLKWSGKTDNAEIRAEETGVDNLDLVFNLGDDGSNNVDFRWNNVSKAKINSSGKFTGHVDWANVDGKDTYSRAEIDSKVNAAKAEANAKADQAQNDVSALSGKVSNIHVGGRNLVRNSGGNPTTTNYWGNVELVKHPFVQNGSVNVFRILELTATEKVSYSEFFPIEPNTEYTLSFYAFNNTALSSADVWIGQRKYGSNVVYQKIDCVIHEIKFPVDSVRHYSVTFTTGEYDEARVRFDNNGSNNLGTTPAELYFFNVKFEKGNIATDWTPAPEDLEDNIDAALNGLQNNANVIKSVSDLANSNKTALATKANSTDFNNLKNNVYDKATSDSRFVNTSGDTMSGNLVLDSSHHLEHLGGVVNFSKRFEDQSSINSLINALRPLTGCSGSFRLTAQDGVLNTGWYNFIWMPHREGGITGDDNGNYGTMLLVPFGGGAAWIVNYYNGFASIRALAWDDNLAATTNTANAAKAKAEANANSIQVLSNKVNQNSSKITDAANAISSLDSKMARLMPQAAYVPVQVGDKTDLNNMKTCGFYLLQGGTSNSPVDGWTYVTVQGISTRLTQFVWKDLDPTQQWCRLYDGNNWTPWTHYTKAL